MIRLKVNAGMRRLCSMLAGSALLILAACGGSSSPVPDGPASPQPVEGERIVSRSVVLTLLADTYLGGGSMGELEVKEREAGDELLVDVHLHRAERLKALYFRMEFDRARFTAAGAERRHLLAPESESLGLFLTDAASGIAEYGEIVIHPGEPAVDGGEKGFSGDGLACTLRLQRGAAEAVRRSSDTTISPEARVTLDVDPASLEMSWGYSSPGDYNQDGKVTITDLTPIGIHYLSEVPEGDPFSIESVVDGDKSGDVKVNDLTPIGLNFQRVVEGYRVYVNADSGKAPATATTPSTIPAINEIALSSASGAPNQERLRLAHDFESLSNGVFIWVRPYEGTSEGSVSHLFQYFAANQLPAAFLNADLTSGAAPLNVSFSAQGSSDTDGSIVSYEFDWDGEGSTFDFEDNAGSAIAQHTYTSEGTYEATVRVTDNDGGSDTASVTIEVGPSQPTPPNADLQLSPTLGVPPLMVELDASGSSDPNGSITLYEWDFDGDGSFDESGTEAVIQHEYTLEGSFMPAVRVTDNEALTDVDASLLVVDAGLTEPEASFTATPSEGFAPLQVNMDASASFDPNGNIVLYEWDYDNDGTFDHSDDEPLTSHTYTLSGNFTAVLRVTDNDDETDTFQRSISVTSPGAEAHLLANPRYGPIPLEVDFDASGSFSSNGDIAQYEWDWDRDGTYDEITLTPLASHTYMTAGVFDATVRVTDSENLTDTAVMLVMPTVDASFPPPDSIFILPAQSFASAGEVVGIEIYTTATSNTFYFVNACPTWPTAIDYATESFNCGTFGGSEGDPDGIWELVAPEQFLLAQDFFYVEHDAGPGRQGIDFVVVPVQGTELVGEAGAMFNIGVVVNSSVQFGFLRNSGFDVTYYQDLSSAQHYWTDDTNTGLPGITLQ